MARNQEPVTDAEIKEAREAIREQHGEIRDYLASEGVDVSRWDARDNRDAESDADVPADD